MFKPIELKSIVFEEQNTTLSKAGRLNLLKGQQRYNKNEANSLK